ncbi:hypothetical protein QWZ16_24530 [Vibrio ostreicida]|uniref:Uncharacterized protein n=1 Tax=Vibrio ostreicida TaxID=526588 RepID=A0ABT8C026_9VIBR|nr:hypothetical protein [Vibrio ostreicida]MDN3612735.1 hypothetical protein [Vibrio ostreicida]
MSSSFKVVDLTHLTLIKESWACVPHAVGNDDLNTLKDPIKGNQGWREFSKPLYNFGQFDRAQADLRNVLSSYDKRNINGCCCRGWTQFKDGYRELIEPHKQALSYRTRILS